MSTRPWRHTGVLVRNDDELSSGTRQSEGEIAAQRLETDQLHRNLTAIWGVRPARDRFDCVKEPPRVTATTEASRESLAPAGLRALQSK